jgi:hypothetical protein
MLLDHRSGAGYAFGHLGYKFDQRDLANVV